VRTMLQKAGLVREMCLTYGKKRLKLCEEERRLWNGNHEGIKVARTKTPSSANHDGSV
jgi:hypothetical protein